MVQRTDGLALPSADAPGAPVPRLSQDTRLMALPECQAPLLYIQCPLLSDFMLLAKAHLHATAENLASTPACTSVSAADMMAIDSEHAACSRPCLLNVR